MISQLDGGASGARAHDGDALSVDAPEHEQVRGDMKQKLVFWESLSTVSREMSSLICLQTLNVRGYVPPAAYTAVHQHHFSVIAQQLLSGVSFCD